MGFQRYYPPTKPLAPLSRADFLDTLLPAVKKQILQQEQSLPHRTPRSGLNVGQRGGLVKPKRNKAE